MSTRNKRHNTRRFKGQGHHSSKRKGSKGKPHSKKQTEFVSKGQPRSVNEKGIELEKTSMIIKFIMFGVFALAGLILCILDIRDGGMVFELTGLFKYSGSLVGVLIMIICIVGICKNKPRVNIKK